MQSSKPRVMLLHYTAPPVVGGVEAVIAIQAALFAQAGYPVSVVCGRGQAADLPAGAGLEVIPEIDTEHPQNVEVAAGLQSGNQPAAFAGLQARIEAALAEVLRPSDIVIAHNVLTTHFNLPLTAALQQLAERGVIGRLIVWAHDVSRYINPASGAGLRFGAPWDLLRTWRPEFTYVAVSARRQHTLAEVLGCPAADIRVIPNGVDPALLLGLSDLGQHLLEVHGLLAADLVMLMPVRVTRAKNIEFALRVTAALKSAGLDARLVVTGPPDPHSPDAQSYYAELQALRDALGLSREANFIYDGTPQRRPPLLLEPPVVAELYRACDVVLMPSHREGFGMPVLEAGLADKPVFATRVPVVDELPPGDLVHLIDSEEAPQSVADRIRAWAGQDSAHRLRRLARSRYRWSGIFETAIEPLLAELAEPARGGVL